MTTTKDLAWLAGIMEGEGSFSVATNKGTWSWQNWNPKITIQLVMTDEDVVRRAFEITNLGHINGPYYPGGNRQDTWHWAVSKKIEVAQILMTLYPLMGERRQERIRELLEIWRGIPINQCKRGHDKQGFAECKICKIELQRIRRKVLQNPNPQWKEIF